MQNVPDAELRFVELIGKMGQGWGLPYNACRVHALLYLKSNGSNLADVSSNLGLTKSQATEALNFLIDFKLAWISDNQLYNAHSDPWDALLTGLDERRRRDLPSMKLALDKCYEDTQVETGATSIEAMQMKKMVNLSDDLTAIHGQAFRLSPTILRGVISISGRAARLLGGRGR